MICLNACAQARLSRCEIEIIVQQNGEQHNTHFYGIGQFLSYIMFDEDKTILIFETVPVQHIKRSKANVVFKNIFFSIIFYIKSILWRPKFEFMTNSNCYVNVCDLFVI